MFQSSFIKSLFDLIPVNKIIKIAKDKLNSPPGKVRKFSCPLKLNFTGSPYLSNDFIKFVKNEPVFENKF